MDNKGSSEIGLLLEIHETSTLLIIGITFDDFSFLGKIPLVSVLFIISVSGLLNTSELLLIKEFKIPYNP